MAERLFNKCALLMLTYLVAGCASENANLEGLQSESPIIRMRSCARLERGAGIEAVPELLAKLDDSDPAVRLVSHQALIKITGEDFGYRAWEAPLDRRESIEKYAKWWEEKAKQEVPPEKAQ